MKQTIFTQKILFLVTMSRRNNRIKPAKAVDTEIIAYRIYEISMINIFKNCCSQE